MRIVAKPEENAPDAIAAPNLTMGSSTDSQKID